MEIRDTEVWGFKHALFGMRNPMDSWDKSDSKYWIPNEFMDEKVCGEDIEWIPFHIGENDMQLAQNLLRAGGEHSKFMRMIHVSANAYMGYKLCGNKKHVFSAQAPSLKGRVD